MKRQQSQSSNYNFEKRIAIILIEPGRTKGCAGEFFKDDGEAITAAFTVILAISTILLWITTRQGARRQSLEMRASVAVAKRSADIAERSLVEIQRALVIVNKFSINPLARDNKIIGYRVTAEFVNTGNTVAKRFTGTANYVLFQNEIAADFKYPDRTEAAPNHGLVGPRVINPFPIDIAIQDIIEIREKKQHGYMYGWVEYNDVFEITRKRRTEFCVEILVVGEPLRVKDPPSPGTSVLGFAGKGPYNATDDDCFYKPGERPPVGGLPTPTQPPPDDWKPA